MNRRDFLLTGAAAAAAYAGGCRKKTSAPLPPGQLLGANFTAGHRLRDGKFPAPSRTEKTGVLIAGGGIAALSAAWQLSRSGFHDYQLLELESATGGNSRWGEGAGGRYPWGAHYLPVPGETAVAVRALLRELGVITGVDAAGRAQYDEFMLCAAPQERLFMRGAWQEGLVPDLGISPAERAQFGELFAAMRDWRGRRGRDGKKAFAIPIGESSRDADLLALDAITMADYLTQRGWNSAPLRWYVDYCCRDDYGAGIAQVSAWAGIHYFSARPGGGAGDEAGLLTWPEGNGWLAERLRERVTGKLSTATLVHRLAADGGGGVMADAVTLADDLGVRYAARRAICAMPRFIARRVVASLRTSPATAAGDAFNYSPWFVANLTLPEAPGGHGAAPAWDNVFYDSRSLGYVNAAHQSLAARPSPVTLTWYEPLDDEAPAQARARALTRPFSQWQRRVLDDLERHHPGITPAITRLDGWLWGHGMIRPVPGFISGATRAAAAQPRDGIFFAHSDLSGISIFEEAHHWGVTAANGVLKSLGLKAEPFA